MLFLTSLPIKKVRKDKGWWMKNVLALTDDSMKQPKIARQQDADSELLNRIAEGNKHCRRAGNTAKTRMFYARKRMSVLLQQAGIDQTYQ